MNLPNNIKIFFRDGDKTFNIYGIVSVEHINGWIKIVNSKGSQYILNSSNINMIITLEEGA